MEGIIPKGCPKEIRCEGVGWIQLAQNRIQRLAVVNTGSVKGSASPWSTSM